MSRCANPTVFTILSTLPAHGLGVVAEWPDVAPLGTILLLLTRIATPVIKLDFEGKMTTSTVTRQSVEYKVKIGLALFCERSIIVLVVCETRYGFHPAL